MTWMEQEQPQVCLTGMILGLLPANERRRYKVTPSLIGWAQTLNQACYRLVQHIWDSFH